MCQAITYSCKPILGDKFGAFAVVIFNKIARLIKLSNMEKFPFFASYGQHCS